MKKENVIATGMVVQNAEGKFWIGGFGNQAKWSGILQNCHKAGTVFARASDAPPRLYVGEKIVAIRVQTLLHIK